MEASLLSWWAIHRPRSDAGGGQNHLLHLLADACSTRDRFKSATWSGADYGCTRRPQGCITKQGVRIEHELRTKRSNKRVKTPTTNPILKHCAVTARGLDLLSQ